jgi:HD-GYP domain-containing protein (c-di-GMP phosphodiesterase class II)
MVCLLIGDGKYASMSDALFGSAGLAGHSTNVAYLSILIGLELQVYIIKERPRLAAVHANDMGLLGLAGMLHDIGKTQGAPVEHHEVHGGDGHPEGYDQHTLLGYHMLRSGRASASVTQVALNHHQRFDGTGWPDMALVTGHRRQGAQAGHDIHVFGRIVGAANVLDNLLRTAAGGRVPPVAALHAFASGRFDGWFDPVVRRAALRRVPPFAVGSEVVLSDGRRAIVVAPNLVSPCRPTVRVREPGARTPDSPDPTLELQQRPELSITHFLGIDVAKWLYTVPPLEASKETQPDDAAGGTAAAA